MRIRLLLFASYAEALGSTEVSLDLPSGATAGDALAAVLGRAGGERLPPRPMLAVNQRYAQPGVVLAEGDEVALIPPVAGG